MERRGVLPITKFAYKTDLVACDALQCVPHTLRSAFERRQEARIVQIDFGSAFDRVIHQGILSSSILRKLDFLCGLMWHSFTTIDYSASWRMVVGVNS